MSPISKSAMFGLLATAATVSAHGYVNKVTVDGTEYNGYLVTEYPYETDPPASIGWTEDATDLGYVAPDAYASGDIICHKDATNAKLSASVKAGGTVELQWNTWPSSHHGPVIDYLANCNGNCSTVDKTALEFFKIDASGLISDTSSPGTWATDNLISNNYTWSVTIPDTIAAGNYVLRHEIIALHSAGNSDGAQNYPQCINLEVTGGGSDNPTGTLGESLYTETDPGILVNIYTTGLTYTMPGPSLYSGGSGSATSAASSAATSAAASTTAAATSAAATSAAASSSAVPTTFATSVVASSSASSVTTAAAVQTSAPAGDDDTCDS